MTTLIERIQTEDREARDQALETYRTILQRSDDPSEGDEKALREAMRTLGYDTARLSVDLQAVQEAVRLEAEAAADTPELTAKVEAVGQRWIDHQAETKRIAQERQEQNGKLNIEFHAIQRERTRAKEAAGKLVALKRKHAELFGVDAPEPEPMPAPRQFSQPAPDPVAIEEHNRKVPAQLPWGSATDGGTQIGLSSVSQSAGSPVANDSPAIGTEAGPGAAAEGADLADQGDVAVDADQPGDVEAEGQPRRKIKRTKIGPDVHHAGGRDATAD